MKAAAIACVAIGLVLAALGAAAKPRAGAVAGTGAPVTATPGVDLPPKPADRAPVHWPVFAAGMAFLGAGLVLTRIIARRAAAANASGAGEAGGGAEGALAAMRRLGDAVTTLREEILRLDGPAFLERVDALTVSEVLTINENRRATAVRLGPKAFAEMICEYAVGERYLNRAWSATADGYTEEAKESLGISEPALKDAVALFERALGQTK